MEPEGTGIYRWDAEDYRASSSQQKKWGRELLGRLELTGGEDVLDIGCGDGTLTVELSRRVPRGSVLGVDSSEEMIRLAAGTYPVERYPNLRWRLLDAGALDFDREFDVVFSNAALHWVKDQRPVLEGIRRSLRPGGRLLVQMGGRGNAEGIARTLIEMLKRPEWSRYFEGFENPYGFYGPEEYRPWLEEAGFTVTRIELLNKDMVHDGREGLAGWIRTTWLPFTQRIPGELRERFIEELVDGYVGSRPPDAHGLVHVDAVRLEYEAFRTA